MNEMATVAEIMQRGGQYLRACGKQLRFHRRKIPFEYEIDHLACMCGSMKQHQQVLEQLSAMGATMVPHPQEGGTIVGLPEPFVADRLAVYVLEVFDPYEDQCWGFHHLGVTLLGKFGIHEMVGQLPRKSRKRPHGLDISRAQQPAGDAYDLHFSVAADGETQLSVRIRMERRSHYHELERPVTGAELVA